MLEKCNILEPVSVGGWTKIRLRRITHSSTCVCMRIRNFCCCFFGLRAARTQHSRFALVAASPPCFTCVLSRCTLVLALRYAQRAIGAAQPSRAQLGAKKKTKKLHNRIQTHVLERVIRRSRILSHPRLTRVLNMHIYMREMKGHIEIR
jgi:hypothetical protein